VTDLDAWLESIGCARHAQAFHDNAITPDLIDELTEGDLRELGLNMGDRKRVLRAIAALAEASATDTAAPAADPPDRPEPTMHAAHAERRRLTVMFVDLVGSTDFSSRLDPEEWSEVLRDYQDAVAGVITRFEGHIAQYLGDGVLCFFGWPRAMEDAAGRGVEAALEILAKIGRISAGGEAIRARIGIATGLVVVGDLIGRGETHDATAIGETPNFAARLQSFAEPGRIVISESTRQLLGDAFVIEPLGRHGFKGLADEQPVFAVLRSNPAHERFAARERQTISAIVGRDNELALLLDRWAMAKESEGQVVTLVGEAGIGKSRICRALADALAAEEYTRISFQCSPYLRDTALWPVASHLTTASGIRAEDDDETRLDKLEALLRGTAESSPRQIAVAAALLDLPGEARFGALSASPSARRAETFGAILDYLVGLSRRRPLLLRIEDVHWIDPTTLELAEKIIDGIERERIMLLITSRPENQPHLPGHAFATAITLNRLGRRGVEEIVARLGGSALPAATIEEIIERTDGVPLFVEELTKAMIDSGQTSVPASLHDTLMARLDRLPEVKEIAQIASVFGREFEAGPLARVAAASETRVTDALDSLRRVELVYPRRSAAARFSFKHALVRDAAYESLLNRRRQEIHARIFAVLSESGQTTPAVLAQHAAEAGMRAEAVEHGRRAAEEALRRPAYAEAISHLETALGALGSCEDDAGLLAERKRLLLLSGQARIAHFGYADAQTVRTYAEIERIAHEIGDDALLIEGLYGRWAGHYVPGDNPAALEVAERICAVSETVNDRLSRALGQRLRGTVLTMMGRVGEAEAALDDVAQHYDRALHGPQAARFGQDVAIARDCYRIGTLTLQGRFDSAADLAAQVRRDLAVLDHPHSTGYALGHLACFLCAAEMLPLGIEIAEECIAVAERDRMPLWAALGRAAIATAHVHEGKAAAAAPELSAAIADLSALDFGVFLTLLLPPQALALAHGGEIAAARARIDEARALMERHRAGFFEAEICRVEGAIALIEGDRAAAEAGFLMALERARALGHLAWELRAAEDLAALWSGDGRAAEGEALKAGILARFVEGHDFPPLRRAARELQHGR